MNVTVGGVVLSSQAIYREAQYHPAGSWEQACHEATRALVVRELLLQQARRDGNVPGDLKERDEQRVIEQLLQRELPVPDVTDAQCYEYYRSNQAKFRGPELFEASHILFAATNADERNELRARAQAVLEEVLASPDRFERLAREHSACPSGASGGRLGQLSPGETVREFERALQALQPGAISTELLQSKHGLHIVRLDQHSPGRPLPYDLVADRVRLYLRERGWRRGVRDLVLRLADAAGVEGFDLTAGPPAPAPDQHPARTGSTRSPAVEPRRRLRVIG